MTKKINMLCAYPYMTSNMQKTLQSHDETTRLVVDSGAFTAWKAGKPIALDDYCRFLESLPKMPWKYFMLDKIGDPEGTLKNYELMLKRGFKPIPIFTRGEDPSVIEDFYKTSDIVGIGGLVQTRKNKGFVNGIMKMIGKRKCHWLGFTNDAFVLHYRPYMCDSSTFDGPLRFGVLKLYQGRGKSITVGKKDFMARPSVEICELIRSYGEDPKELAKAVNWVNTGTNKSTLERLTYKSAMWKNREIEKKTGSKIFFAITSNWKVTALNWADAWLKKHQPSLYR